MDNRVSCTLCSGNGWFLPVPRDIWVPNSLTYCLTSQEICTPTPFLAFLSTTISAIKLVECSYVLLGRIILSPLLLVKNYKLGEKYSPQTLSWLHQGASSPVIPLFRNTGDGCRKALPPAPEPLALLQSYPLSSAGARTPVKQGPKMLGITLMGEEESQ